MKKTTLESILKVLKNPTENKYIIKVKPETAEKARKSIEKMMELSKSIK
jgi:quinolinate synthase